MGEIVNLRSVRKRQAAKKAEAEAQANRLAFGTSKNEKNRASAQRSLEETCLDGHRREKGRDDE